MHARTHIHAYTYSTRTHAQSSGACHPRESSIHRRASRARHAPIRFVPLARIRASPRYYCSLFHSRRRHRRHRRSCSRSRRYHYRRGVSSFHFLFLFSAQRESLCAVVVLSRVSRYRSATGESHTLALPVCLSIRRDYPGLCCFSFVLSRFSVDTRVRACDARVNTCAVYPLPSRKSLGLPRGIAIFALESRPRRYGLARDFTGCVVATTASPSGRILLNIVVVPPALPRRFSNRV